MAFNTLQVQNGFGRPIYTMTPAERSANAKWLIFAELFNFADLFFIRTSVCLFTLRLLPKTEKWSIYFVYLAWVFNFTSTLDNMVSFGVQCQPLRGLWDTSINAKCFDIPHLKRLFYAATVLGVLADFIIVIVPTTVIRRTQMTRSTKIGVCLVMSLSFITAGLSIGKCIVTPGIRDPYFDSVPVQIFSLCEENLGIICASAPAIRQLYLSVNDRLKTTGSSKHTDDPESPVEKKDEPEPPVASPKSNHSSGIFGKSTHKSIIRHNFETHRKLHDIAGHQSHAYSTLARVGSGISHASSAYTAPPTVMGCNASPVVGSKGRQGSLATLLPEKPRSGSITGLRKEGQSATPTIPTVATLATPTAPSGFNVPAGAGGPVVSIPVSLPVVADEKADPISPISQFSAITLSQRRDSISPQRRDASSTRSHERPPTRERKLSLSSSRGRSQSVSETTQSAAPSAAPSDFPVPPQPPAVVEETHERKTSRSKLSLPFPLKTSRSHDNLKDYKKKTQSLGVNHSGTFYRPDTNSTKRSHGSSDVPEVPDVPLPHTSTATAEAISHVTGVTRQAQSMQPPQRPPRSPLLSHPVKLEDEDASGGEGEGDKKRDTLSPEAAAKKEKYLSTMSSTSSIYPEREGKALPPPPLPPPPKHLTEARAGVKSLYI